MDSIQEMEERWMLAKFTSVMDNTSKPLHHDVESLRSCTHSTRRSCTTANTESTLNFVCHCRHFKKEKSGKLLLWKISQILCFSFSVQQTRVKRRPETLSIYIYLLYSLSCCHFSAWLLSRLAFCCFVCWHFPPEALLDNLPIDGIIKVNQISKCWLKQVFSKRQNLLFSCRHPQLSSDFYLNKVNLFDLCFCVCFCHDC